MDQTSLIMVLLGANVAIIGVATLTMFRRGTGRQQRNTQKLGTATLESPAPDRLSQVVGPGSSAPAYGSAARFDAAEDANSASTPTDLPDTISDHLNPATSPQVATTEPKDYDADGGAQGDMSAARTDQDVAPEQTWEQSLNGALIEPETGFLTRKAWDEALRHEEHRFARYRRPVSMVIFELDGMDALAARLGRESADRLIGPVAHAMGSSARVADIIARVGRTRFLALLPETDEISAINYIERVRTACDLWLAAGAVAVRLAIGWAQPPVGGTLADALKVAHQRLDGDRRRQGGMRSIGDEQADGDHAPVSTPSPSAQATRGQGQPGSDSARRQDFENILADFLEHPDAPETNAARGASSDDSDA